MATIGSNATATSSSFYVSDSTDNLDSAIRRISSTKSSSSSPSSSSAPTSTDSASSQTSAPSVIFSDLVQANIQVAQAKQRLASENQKIKDLHQAIDAALRTRDSLQSQWQSARQAQANVKQDNVLELLKES